MDSRATGTLTRREPAGSEHSDWMFRKRKEGSLSNPTCLPGSVGCSDSIMNSQNNIQAKEGGVDSISFHKQKH